MDWITTFESLATGALGGLGTVYWLSGYLGRIWLEKQKAAYSKELEEFKNALERDKQRIQAEIDRSVFVTRAQFDTEFTAMKEVFGLLTAAGIALNGVRPVFQLAPLNETIDARRQRVLDQLAKLQEAHDDLLHKANGLVPFYPLELHQCVRECQGTAYLECIQARDDLYQEEYEFGHQWRKNAETNQATFKEAYDRAALVIRNRIERLAVLPPR
jgi:hypothetical protein